MTIGEHKVEKILVEAQVSIAKEFYAAVLNHQETKGPLLLFSTEGGMDVEEITSDHPDKMAHSAGGHPRRRRRRALGGTFSACSAWMRKRPIWSSFF